MPSLFPEPDQPRVLATRTSPSATVHAHCDGGARGNPGPAGFGAALVDEAGETLAELSEFLGIRTNNYAEYAGLLATLAWTIEHGYKRLEVVSDSKLMVMQIQGRFQVKSPDLKPLWTEARRMIAKLDSFGINHALRHKNKVADRLANEAMDRGMGRSSSAAKLQTGSVPPAERLPGPPPGKVVSSATAAAPGMLRGFTRGGVIHLLGGSALPDGIFVKIIPE